MKKIFLFICTGILLNSLAKAQNSSYDSNAVSIGGTNNVAFGLGALKVSNGQHNVAIGIGALENLGAASSNTAVGFGAMQNSVGGFFNTAIGLGALRNNQYDYNTALGWGALNSNTGGEFNTGTGGEALANNTTGISNTANGFRALFSNTTGDANTANGLQSLYFNITGSYNTANGYKSLYNNTTGSYNTSNGYEALVANTSGEFNTSNGFRSFYNNTTGTAGTATGHGALYANTTGNNNTATGLIALFNNTTGNNNTAHGKDALVHNITGDNNSALGFGADVATGSLSNATAIGALAIINESNAIQLGNNGVTKIFAGVGNNATIITGGLQVTGGTPAVGKVLTSDAAGVASWQTPVMGIGGSGTLNYVSKFTPDGVTLGNSQIFDNGTNIGIGNASPLAKLDITGNIKIADGTQGAGKVLTSDANGLASWQTPSGSGGASWLLTGNAGTVDGTNFIGTTDSVPFNIRVNNQRAGRIESSYLTANSFYGYLSGFSNTTGNGNTGMGWQALQSNTSGIYNTANGYQSLSLNRTGSYNTANGNLALYFNNDGNNNTATGLQSLFLNSNGNDNTATGFQSLFFNSTGNKNIAVGRRALFNNTTGSNNTAIGDSAGVANGNLVNTTALGYHAIARQNNSIQLGDSAVTTVFAGVGNASTLVTGRLQVTNGAALGRVLTSDAFGVATWQTPGAGIGGGGTLNFIPKFTPNGVTLGNSQLFDNGTNIGIGTIAPVARLDIIGNIKITDGTQGAGRVLTSNAAGVASWQMPAAGWLLTGNAGTIDGTNFIGTTDNVPFNIRVANLMAGRIESAPTSANTFYGFQAGLSNSGRRNSAYGYQALSSNTSGLRNTANGAFALFLNSDGNTNNAIGVFALAQNTHGSGNTATGDASLFSNTNGNNNTATGNMALQLNTSGDGNTAVGLWALSNNTTGNNNTAVGNNANVNTGNLINTTAIGNGALATQSHMVRLGNTAVTRIEGYGNVFITSDGRFKNKISETDVKGLEFITKLRPVVYNMDTKKLQKFLTKNMPDSISKNYMNEDFGPSSSIRQSGFIAQEVEKAAKETGYDFNGVHKPENENDNYSLAYSQFVVPLVKAVQEQQKMIEDLQKQLKQLQQNQQNNLTETLPSVSAIELADNNAVVLNQNVPNPFAQQTSISYNIPVSANAAQIIFYSLEGRLMKTANISTRGKGILNVFASDLSSGSYTYSLMIDGKIVDTKKLVKQ